MGEKALLGRRDEQETRGTVRAVNTSIWVLKPEVCAEDGGMGVMGSAWFKESF